MINLEIMLLLFKHFKGEERFELNLKKHKINFNDLKELVFYCITNLKIMEKNNFEMREINLIYFDNSYYYIIGDYKQQVVIFRKGFINEDNTFYISNEYKLSILDLTEKNFINFDY